MSTDNNYPTCVPISEKVIEAMVITSLAEMGIFKFSSILGCQIGFITFKDDDDVERSLPILLSD